MEEIDYNEAVLELNDCLAEKNPKTTKGIIHYLKQYKNRHNNDAVRARAAEVMIKYYERQADSERFQLFLKEKAKVVGKKPENLTPEDYESFRRDFNKLEHSKKQEQS